MLKSIKKWTSPNKIWEVYLDKDYGKIAIKNKKTGHINIPNTYKYKGKIVFDDPYDDPYMIPQYVKDQFGKMIK